MRMFFTGTGFWTSCLYHTPRVHVHRSKIHNAARHVLLVFWRPIGLRCFLFSCSLIVMLVVVWNFEICDRISAVPTRNVESACCGYGYKNAYISRLHRKKFRTTVNEKLEGILDVWKSFPPQYFDVSSTVGVCERLEQFNCLSISRTYLYVLT